MWLLKSFLIFVTTASSYAQDVSWRLLSVPVYFGKDGYFQCNITTDKGDCSDKIRQWFGGKLYSPLCNNNICRNNEKYEVMQSSNSCLYTLVVKQLSPQDVDCDYTCYYGVKLHRKHLEINSDTFMYLPPPEKIEVETDINSDNIWISVMFEKMYPLPSCYATLTEHNIIKQMEMSSIKTSLFKVNLSVTLHMPSSCSGESNVFCNIGATKQNITKVPYNFCKHKSNGLEEFYVVCIVVLSIVLLFVIFAIIWRSIRKTQKRTIRNNQPESEELTSSYETEK